jgi:RND family efflux transporter MFP subunit
VQFPQPAADAAAIRAIGRLEAAGETSLGFPVGGVVAAVEVEIGDRVRAGQLLARLDLTALDADVAQAGEQLARARRDLARTEALVARQLVPRQQGDDARTQVEVAAAGLRSAGYSQRYGRIEAPADGVVLSRFVEPGEVVLPGQPVVRTSSQGGSWLLPVQLADRDAAAIQPGAPATVTVDGAPGLAFEARVLRIGGQASATSGAIEVELQVLASPAQLRSGMVAKAYIRQDAGDELMIPVAAVLRADDGKAWLMVVEDGLARQREVALGEVRGESVQVMRGLSPEDQVITAGAAYVDDGAPVRILAAP